MEITPLVIKRATYLLLLLTAFGYPAFCQQFAWQAKWIEPGYAEDTINRPCAVLRKDFVLTKTLKTAKLYITSHGLYEASINGKKVGDAYFTPGWTSYHKRLLYQEYEVKGMLDKGKNKLSVLLASGWYRGRLGLDMSRNRYGNALGLLCQLEMVYTDGSRVTVTSDSSWTSAPGGTRSEIYDGEIQDLNAMAQQWDAVKLGNYKLDNLYPAEHEPVRSRERFKALKVFIAPNGDTLVDFGQNLAGFVSLRVKGRRGDTIRIKHAEVLDKAGNFYTASLRTAKAEDVYILKDEQETLLEPKFTWHGFRYVKLEGFRGLVRLDQLEAIALYSDMKQTGEFACSDSLLNRLQKNIVWSQNSNFIDVPIDCPQRDERLGWLGDALVFCRTAAFNRDVRLFFKKWLKDVATDQFSDGSVPQVVPNILGDWGGSSGWADVTTVLPWTLYEVYGDTSVLQDQYASMKAWVDYMDNSSPDGLFKKGFQFGDWLSFRSEGIVDRSALTDVHLVAQCFYAHSVQLLIHSARVLGKSTDLLRYGALLEKVKNAFMLEYVSPSGRLMSNTQTAYVLALQFDMLPETMRAEAARKLVENIRSYDDHLTTGFLGTPYICHVLSRFGYTDVAYKLLMQEGYPSWLYPVKRGATTIWERWDGIKPNGDFQDPEMNSFNHYAYGAIGDWMYQHILGIQCGAPGYKKVIIAPKPGGGLTWAKGSYLSAYGRITVDWKITGDKLELKVKLPKGTTAEVHVPDITGKLSKKLIVKAGSYVFKG